MTLTENLSQVNTNRRKKIEDKSTTVGTAEMKSPFQKAAFDSLPDGKSKNDE